MKLKRLDNEQILEITADDADKARLRKHYADDMQSSEAELDFLHDFLYDNELTFIDPAETGDLTSAPMVGYRYVEMPVPDGVDATHLHVVSNYKGVLHYEPVIYRWAFMDYQVKSMLEELLDNGFVRLLGGKVREFPTEEELEVSDSKERNSRTL